MLKCAEYSNSGGSRFYFQTAAIPAAIASVGDVKEYVDNELHLSYEHQERRRAKTKFHSGLQNDPFSESVSIHLQE